jgi:ribosomal protein S18 acetylase RimI-like enzyme
LLIRPLVAHEIATFSRVCGQDLHASDVESYLQSMFQRGAMRLEWCFVAEEADQIIGTIAYWTLPNIGKPLDIVLFSLPWERADVFTLGKQLLQETLFEIQHRHGGEAIGHVLDTPATKPQWQVFPEQRMDLLKQLGFQHRRSTFRFKWQRETDPPIVPARLLFRSLPEVGEQAFIAAIEQVSKGTLDQRIQHDIDLQGPEPQAREFFKEMQQMEYDPAWWHLAYNQEQELVGLIMPGHNLTVAVIDYIGVVPAFRGYGYVDDLLARGAASLFHAGLTTIIADTDLVNVPMANAFRRANYQQFAIRHEFEFPASV